MKIKSSEIKHFLQEEYAFRRNLLSGKIEYRMLSADAATSWKTFTQEALNSVTLAAEEVFPECRGLEKKLHTQIFSLQTPDFDPALEFLRSLPVWDGKNYVGALLDRLPGLRAEQRYWLTLWLRSMVAHWLQLDQLHGNDVVPVLIGAQGCGKSTFCRQLLPEHLREYYLDHVNLGNKFDKEMALTNNLLVNIDELEQVRPSRQAELKQLISKTRVNGRPVYGRAQADRPRYASFVATTNNCHPLHDPTGSRRYLCIEIPNGALIDNVTPIDYCQLYAQIISQLGFADGLGQLSVEELNARHAERGERYWLTVEETLMLQRANAAYQSTLDLERIVVDCFRKPAADEPCQPLSMPDVVDFMARRYPFIRPTHSMKVQVGIALAAAGFAMTRDASARRYYVIPVT